MVLGVTGTRNGLSEPQRGAFLRWMRRAEFGVLEAVHHGDCRGADVELARFFQKGYGSAIQEIHPAEGNPRIMSVRDFDILHPAKPPLDRNRDIVIASALMLAFPKYLTEEFRGSGTWATIRYARTQHKPLVIFWPDGGIRTEEEA